jgi:hypothetical protein
VLSPPHGSAPLGGGLGHRHRLLVHDGGPAPLDGVAHSLSFIFGESQLRNTFLENDVLDIAMIRESTQVGLSAAPCSCTYLNPYPNPRRPFLTHARGR